jgi:hypothetical protein
MPLGSSETCGSPSAVLSAQELAMSIKSSIGRSIAFGFVLSLSGVAFARQPPSLEQLRSTSAFVSETPPLRSAGYRDVDARFPYETRTAIVSKGRAVVGGYRDLHVRFQ